MRASLLTKIQPSKARSLFITSKLREEFYESSFLDFAVSGVSISSRNMISLQLRRQDIFRRFSSNEARLHFLDTYHRSFPGRSTGNGPSSIQVRSRSEPGGDISVSKGGNHESLSFTPRSPRARFRSAIPSRSVSDVTACIHSRIARTRACTDACT
jgi:hypothetical protein